MNKNLLICCCLLLSFWVQAQTNCQERYDRESIYVRTEFFRGPCVVKGGKSKPVGLFFNRVRPEFELTPVAAVQFQKAQKAAKTALTVGVFGLAGATTGFLMAFRSLNHSGNNPKAQRQYDTGMGLMLGSAVVTATVALPLNVFAQRKLSDAIWQRNRELLK